MAKIITDYSQQRSYTTVIKMEAYMVLIGLSWLVAWLLYSVFAVELVHATLATALLFIIIGVLTGERPFINK